MGAEVVGDTVGESVGPDEVGEIEGELVGSATVGNGTASPDPISLLSSSSPEPELSVMTGKTLSPLAATAKKSATGESAAVELPPATKIRFRAISATGHIPWMPTGSVNT